MKHAPIASALLLAACRSAAPEPPPPPSPPPAAHAPSLMPPHTHAPESGTLHWSDPPSWRRVTPTSAMRRAQFAIPGATPEADGELAVFWFGAGQGGSIDSNLTRWYGQFEQADGRPSGAVATRETRTAHGLTVTVTRVEGRFTGGGMPGAAPAAPREGYAMLAAIAETPNGPWFFKMTGPRATVAAASSAFDAMVASFEFR